MDSLALTIICSLVKDADNGTCGTVDFTGTSRNRNVGDGMVSQPGHISKGTSVVEDKDIITTETTVGATVNERSGIVGNGVVVEGVLHILHRAEKTGVVTEQLVETINEHAGKSHQPTKQGFWAMIVLHAVHIAAIGHSINNHCGSSRSSC
jgi:hypothetical protein